MAGTQARVVELKKRASDLLKRNDNDHAFPFVSDILNLNFEDPQGLYMAGVWFRNRGHPGMAAQFFRRCVALTPDKVNPWLLFGASLHDLHQYDAAVECFRRARQISPNEPACFANLAASHVQMGEFAEALNYVTEALKREPTHKTALACRGMANLGLERWKEGFADYKHIYGGQVIIRVYKRQIIDGKEVDEPEWDGTSGKTVVVQSDQGLGDEIRYSSILPDMAKDCKKVILECHPKLENLFKRSFPDIDVHGTKKQKQDVKWIDDYEIDASYHVSGLGRFYRTKTKDFPRKPYLVANEELRLKWREQLKPFARPYVGIAWVGGLIGTGREWRSTQLNQWEGMIRQGGSFVDLSYHDSRPEIKEAGVPIFRPDVNQQDYDDTLALLAELDLVVCVPTTVMHAAGAINKETWVLVPHWTPWEFGKTRDDMIWYPKGTVKLFRADSPDFTNTIQRMSDAYGEFLASGVHWDRPKTDNRIYRPAELDYSQGQQAGGDYPVNIASVADQAKRTDGVHF
jgi:tetratricopeptide (TPR) repeat protein